MPRAEPFPNARAASVRIVGDRRLDVIRHARRHRDNARAAPLGFLPRQSFRSAALEFAQPAEQRRIGQGEIPSARLRADSLYPTLIELRHECAQRRLPRPSRLLMEVAKRQHDLGLRICAL